MNKSQPSSRRSRFVFGLAILAFSLSFFTRGGSESGIQFSLWRDQPLIAIGLLASSIVLLFVWWRGSTTKLPA